MRTLSCAAAICLAAALAHAAVIGKATVTAEQAPVMSGKQVVATAKKGDVLDVTELKGDWFGVAPSQGWIHKANVRYEPAAVGTAPAQGPSIPPSAMPKLSERDHYLRRANNVPAEAIAEYAKAKGIDGQKAFLELPSVDEFWTPDDQFNAIAFRRAIGATAETPVDKSKPIPPAPTKEPSSAAPAPAAGIAPEKEAQALRLLGGWTRLEATDNSVSAAITADQIEAVRRASDLAGATLRAKGLADGLRPAAAQVAGCGPNLDSLTVRVQGAVEIAKIREVLGKEEAAEQTEFLEGPLSSPVTWHRYGWLRFGAVDGKVVAVRADCRKAPPPVAEARTTSPAEARPKPAEGVFLGYEPAWISFGVPNTNVAPGGAYTITAERLPTAEDKPDQQPWALRFRRAAGVSAREVRLMLISTPSSQCAIDISDKNKTTFAADAGAVVLVLEPDFKGKVYLGIPPTGLPTRPPAALSNVVELGK